jgi:hypothetical protein
MAFLILETATGLLFGGFLGAQISGQDHTAALWILGVSYGLLVIAKVSTQRLFPSAVIDQLEATHHLEVSKKEVARRDVISGFITHSISALNEQTCALSGDREESLCSRAVGAGLAAVIDPLITRPQYLFDCNESQFTIAAVVTYQAPQPRGWRQDIITFRDDLDMGGLLSYDLLFEHSLKGAAIDIQKAIQRCLNDNSFVGDSFQHSDRTVAVIAAPIPLVCETTESNGVLLFFTRCGHECPRDVEGTLQIFGRIDANWLAKYSDCVAAKEQEAKTPAQPEIVSR